MCNMFIWNNWCANQPQLFLWASSGLIPPPQLLLPLLDYLLIYILVYKERNCFSCLFKILGPHTFLRIYSLIQNPLMSSKEVPIYLSWCGFKTLRNSWLSFHCPEIFRLWVNDTTNLDCRLLLHCGYMMPNADVGHSHSASSHLFSAFEHIFWQLAF